MASNSRTLQEYDYALAECRDVFYNKTKDYGTSWRVFRIISIADQLYIKAKRIQNLQAGVVAQVNDSIESEFMGMVNYGIIGLIQMELHNDAAENMPIDEVMPLYNFNAEKAKLLMLQKNNDYGEAWRDMSIESFADLSLVKALRIKQIILNENKTLVSEGVDANLLDIINYSMFALIKINETNAIVQNEV